LKKRLLIKDIDKISLCRAVIGEGGLFSHIDYGTVSRFFLEFFAVFLAEKDGI
jgi:hypothetical protein